MPKPLFELRNFVGGMVRDLLKRLVPKNQYIDAENINLTPNHVESTGGATTSMGSTFAFDLGTITYTTSDYQGFGIYFDLSSPGISHTFVTDTSTVTISSAMGSEAARYGDLVDQLQISAIGGEVYQNPSPLTGTVLAAFKLVGYGGPLSESIAGIDKTVIVIKEYYGDLGTGTHIFRPLKSVYINTDLFIISTTDLVFRLGVAKKDYVIGTWTYVVLLQTKQLQYLYTQVFDMDGQIDFGDKVALYFTSKGEQTRAMYVKKEDVYTANQSMIYYDSITPNPRGYYIYNTLLQETGLQVYLNLARAQLSTVYDTGGALKSGNKQYFIRQLVDVTNKSGIGQGSGFVSVFSDAQTNTLLYGGNAVGEQTTKRVELTISNLDPNLYTKFELIVIENQDVLTPYIVNTFDISAETMTVVHTGSETLVALPVSEFSTQQVLIKSAGNLVIARNRLFLSDIELQLDTDLSVWAKTILIENESVLVDAIGNQNLTDADSVNEYQLDSNIFYKIGYNNYEKYRFGIIPFWKNGTVSAPYFIADHQILYDTDSDILTYASSGDKPESIRILYIRTTVDLTYDVDGTPLKDLIYGYSIVRQPCIPEVLATGWIMPSNVNSYTGFQTSGHNLITQDTYAEGSTNIRRSLLAFMSPDIMFGTTTIEPTSGDKILNFGNSTAYNYYFELKDNGILYGYREVNGSVGRDTPVELPVTKGENVPFNTEGEIEIFPTYKYSTIVEHTGVVESYGNNQRIIAVHTSDYATAGSVTDKAFYYAIYFRELVNKYGAEKDGFYQGCNHFTLVGTDDVYVDDVYGGDTFVQKNITKYSNKALVNIDFTLDLQLVSSPAASPVFGNATYQYCILYQYPDVANYIYSDVVSVVRNGGNNTKSVVLTWEMKIGTSDVNLGDTTGATISILRNVGAGWFFLDEPVPDNATTFTDTNFTATGPSFTPAERDVQLRCGLTYYTANKGNYQLRLFSDTNPDPNFPYQTSSLTEWLHLFADEGELNYHIEFSPQQEQTTERVGFDPTQNTDSTLGNILYYSELMPNESEFDFMRVFKPLNKKSYPAKYGTIHNMFLKDMNFLIIGMDEQVLIQSLDQQQNQTNTDGTIITIGDGTVVGAREGTISNIGMPFKTMAIQYKNSRGIIHVNWFNPYLKKLMILGKSLIDVGDDLNFQSFISDNTNLNFSENSIIFGYDFVNDEILMSAKVGLEVDIYDNGDTYDEGDIVYTEDAVLQKHYYICTHTGTIGIDPTTPEGQVQNWEIYRQSNFTLAVNDRLTKVSNFLSYFPERYLQYNETFLTFALKLNDDTLAYMYEHNKGFVMYDEIPITSYITVVFNEAADYQKSARVLFADMQFKPLFIKVKTLDRVTYSEAAIISFQRPHWESAVRNDAMISGANPSGLNDLHTDQISGQLFEVTFYFNSDDGVNVFKEAIMRMKPQPQFYSS